MAKIKSTRSAIVPNSKSEDLTDELYEQLNTGNKFIAKLAEALKIDVQIGDYNGNKYVTRETVIELDQTMF